MTDNKSEQSTNNKSTNTIEAALDSQESASVETNSEISEPASSESDSAIVSDSETKSPGVLSILQSVIAAMFGIQSDEKRQADFEKGHPGTYIFVGIVIVIIFIFVIIGIVNSALEGSGIPH